MSGSAGAGRKGTPPRMRGKLSYRLKTYPCQRNTPAYAGKTSKSSTIARGSGTPPRMRGKQSIRRGGEWVSRNTPAYAGKTICPACDALYQTEHPRVCGENEKYEPRALIMLGTPPRMRGKHFTTSTFTERNSILVSLRATNPTLQQARQASQIAVGRSTLTVGNSPRFFAPGDNHPRAFLGTSPHPNRVCGLVHSAAFLGVPLGEGLLSGPRPEVTDSRAREECVILLVFVTGKAPGA